MLSQGIAMINTIVFFLSIEIDITNTNFYYVYFQDNTISSFHRGTFHSQANPQLCVLDLSFNRIEVIPYDTFRFPNLQRLHLDDNKIKQVYKNK